MLPFTFGDDPVSPGDSIGVQCVITKGDVPIQIDWMFNDQSLRTGQNGINIINISTKTSLLNIVSINAQHRGNYTCIAKNKAGLSEFAAELKVNGTWRSFKYTNNIIRFIFPYYSI